ncbi:hypothetical protein ACHAWF_005169 [Thalassiosira exigua]
MPTRTGKAAGRRGSAAAKAKANAPKVPPTAPRSPASDWRTLVRESFSALFDVVGDWAYLYAIYNRDFNGDGVADEGWSENYDLILLVLLASCIVSTIFGFWTVATTFGRRCGREGKCGGCTAPRLALMSILLDDIPQFLLTAYIDFHFTGGLTPAGMMNICSSLSGLVNRATTRYDEIQEENDEGGGQGASRYKAMP